MHVRCTVKMRKCWCMKFLCIISGCPVGARKWHISYFSMHLHRKTAQAEACAAQTAHAGIPTARFPPEQVFCHKRSSRSSTYSLPPFSQLWAYHNTPVFLCQPIFSVPAVDKPGLFTPLYTVSTILSTGDIHNTRQNPLWSENCNVFVTFSYNLVCIHRIFVDIHAKGGDFPSPPIS